MIKISFYLTLIILLASSCTTHGPFYVGTPYGGNVTYGERRHAGLDFNLRIKTPIIAATEGTVSWVNVPCPNEPYCGGIFVELQHDNQFRTLYGHLKKAYVKDGQVLKRGQLIGLSGASNSGYPHLHFVIFKLGGAPVYSSC